MSIVSYHLTMNAKIISILKGAYDVLSAASCHFALIYFIISTVCCCLKVTFTISLFITHAYITLHMHLDLVYLAYSCETSAKVSGCVS